MRVNIGMPVVRTDGRTGGRAGGRVYGHVITKFSQMGSLPDFFTHGAPRPAIGVVSELICVIR